MLSPDPERRVPQAISKAGVCVVIPLFNEADTIGELVEKVQLQLGGACDQVILVNDGSTDGSARRCDEIAVGWKNVRVIHFPTNRGKTLALAAGFDACDSDFVITMDADLQDDPTEIPRLLAALEGGLDMVCGWKKQRNDPLGKRLPSKIYNGACARMFGLRLHDMNTGFKAMRAEVARAAVLKHDYHRLLPAIAAAQGFKVGEVPVMHHPRRSGKSKFGFERYWRGFRDATRLWLEINRGRISPIAKHGDSATSDRVDPR